MQHRRWVFAGLSRQLCSDDSFDDNRDDNRCLNDATYTAICGLSCPVTASPRSCSRWQGDFGGELGPGV
jgi:hypothetical protein